MKKLLFFVVLLGCAKEEMEPRTYEESIMGTWERTSETYSQCLDASNNMTLSCTRGCTRFTFTPDYKLAITQYSEDGAVRDQIQTTFSVTGDQLVIRSNVYSCIISNGKMNWTGSDTGCSYKSELSRI